MMSACAGRCVNTIVLIRPKRAASADETNCDIEPSSPTRKKNVPATWIDMLKRRNNHNASRDCTTKPPPNASRLNSADNRSTIDLDFASGADLPGPRTASTAGERLRYTANAINAMIEYATN